MTTDSYVAQLDRLRNEQHLPAPLLSDPAEKFLTRVDRQAEVSAGQRDNRRDKWSVLKPTSQRLADVDVREDDLMAHFDVFGV